MRRLAGTKLLVDLLESLLAVGRAVLLRESCALILCHGGEKSLLVTEHINDSVIVVLTVGKKSADKYTDRNLAVLVYLNVENTGRVRLVLKPRASVGYNRSSVVMLALLVNLVTVIHTGRTNELRNDNTLRAVNNKGTVLGHKREIAEEDLRSLKLTRSLVNQTHAHLHVRVVGDRPVLALLNGVSGGRIDRVIGELNRQVSRVVNDGRYVLQDLIHTLLEEPLVRVLLNLNEIRHVYSCLNLGKTLSDVGTELSASKHHK